MWKQKYTNVQVNEFANYKNLGMCESHFDLPNAGETPHQPVRQSFLKRVFGKTEVSSCALQGSWFVKWKCLHYDLPRDLHVVFCLTCVSAVKIEKVRLTTGNVQDSTFVSRGFSNWKDASRCFSNHEKSTTHGTAIEIMITLTKGHRRCRWNALFHACNRETWQLMLSSRSCRNC